MSALDCIERLYYTNIPLENLKYCLVDKNKNPYRIDGSRASVNKYDDFVSIENLIGARNIDEWSGLGISIQASDVIAIDLDHCCSTPLEISSCNERAMDIIDMFKDFAYIEFSFSGKGIRIIFRDEMISPYKESYYIKNSKIGVEYYQPKFDGEASNRFVTITGNAIYNNNLSSHESHKDTIITFLDKYMRRSTHTNDKEIVSTSETRDLNILLSITKKWAIVNQSFQDDWFKDGIHPTTANPDESERDFRIIEFLYFHVTQDMDMVKKLFEESIFFKTKDSAHIRKWNYNDCRYFKWQFSQVVKKYKQ